MDPKKLVGAVVVAGASAMICGFVAQAVVQPQMPKANAFKVEVAETAAAPAAAAPAADAAAPAADAAAAAAPAAAPTDGAEPVLALLAAADVAKGEKTAKVCAACHTFKKGEPNRVGPNLYGIVGSKHAHSADFKYSDAMKATSDKTWSLAELNAYLWNPKKHIPGNKMAYAGLKKVDDRAAVLAYLRTLSDAPVALPSAEEIAAEGK